MFITERNWKIIEMRVWEKLFIVHFQNKFYLNIIIYKPFNFCTVSVQIVVLFFCFYSFPVTTNFPFSHCTVFQVDCLQFLSSVFHHIGLYCSLLCLSMTPWSNGWYSTSVYSRLFVRSGLLPLSKTSWGACE